MSSALWDPYRGMGGRGWWQARGEAAGGGRKSLIYVAQLPCGLTGLWGGKAILLPRVWCGGPRGSLPHPLWDWKSPQTRAFYSLLGPCKRGAAPVLLHLPGLALGPLSCALWALVTAQPHTKFFFSFIFPVVFSTLFKMLRAVLFPNQSLICF